MTCDLQPKRVLTSIKGVWINGIHYQQGDHVEYWHLDRPQGHDEHGRLGTVNLVYTILHNLEGQTSFAEVSPILVTDRLRSLYVVDKVDLNEARMDGFDRAPSGPTLIVALTTILCKIKLVPHFHDENKLIGLRMHHVKVN